MPVSDAPVMTQKVPLGLDEDEMLEGTPFEEASLAQLSAIGKQASRKAQADLHKRGLSYVVGRDGVLIEVLPNGEEIPYIAKP